MRILFDINHPAHVHFFRNAIKVLESTGHDIFITARKKEITTHLLEREDLEYHLASSIREGFFNLGKEFISHQRFVYGFLKRERIDLVLSINGAFNAHAAKLLSIPSMIFDDSERATLQNSLTHPIVDCILTPYCYGRDINSKQIRYNGFHELAYLHENRFLPSPGILDELGVEKGEKFVLMRFVGWGAGHDIGKSGFSLSQKSRAVKELSGTARVFITSEAPLPGKLDEYKIAIPPEKIHDAMYYASLLLGDTQTMTTEAAVLGTPAIRSNSFVGPDDMMNFIELEKHGLIYNFRNPDDAIEKAVELIGRDDLKEEWQIKRKDFLTDKIDVTAFMVWFVENYPGSAGIMKERPEYQNRFR